MFYEFKHTQNSYKFEEDPAFQPDPKTQAVSKDLPTQVFWINDLIYLATKKSYMICRKDGSVV